MLKTQFLVLFLIFFTPNSFCFFDDVAETVNGSSYINESHVPRTRIERDKPEEFVCTGSDLTTGVSKLIGAFWPNTMPKDKNITLYLVTRRARVPLIINNKHQIDGNAEAYLLDHFVHSRKTVIISHGFTGDITTPWLKRMAEAYMNFEDVNVIIVDWGVLGHTMNYQQAARGTISAGSQIADLLGKIYTKVKGPDMGDIHMIGFSLGAHVVGIAADQFKDKQIDWNISRITGLDPAYPCFSDNKLALDADDAFFVDIIHTNGNKKKGIGFGTPHELGDIDFYPNGGEVQPGCSKLPTFLWNLIITVAGKLAEAICSHTRAVEYFIESLEIAAKGETKDLWGVSWDRTFCSAMEIIGMNSCRIKTPCETMGIRAEKTDIRGSYYVVTAKDKPFNDIKTSDRNAAYTELERSFGK